MLLSEIMSKNPVTVTLDDRLYHVKDLFDANSFRHLPVVEEGELMGILSDRDLYKNLSPNIGSNRFTFNDVETLDIPVHQIVTRHPITLRDTDSVKDALNVLVSQKISAIPILNSDNKLVGIVSWKDILNAVAPLLI